jgi:hypothetical protein
MAMQRTGLWSDDARVARQGVRFVLALAMLASLAAAGAVRAATITVTNSGDAAGTTCGASCSLRQAIGAANLTATADTIEFNIPSAGPHIIAPASALPVISQPLTIDGYTQPGALANTLTEGDNAVILIGLNGAGAGANADGIAVCANNVVIRGLSIDRFAQNGIVVGAVSGGTCAIDPVGVVIAGNFIGLAPNGSSNAGNSDVGVRLTTAQATIGGTTPGDRNLISNNNSGVLMNPSIAPTQILNNYIGLDRTGRLARGNSASGITFSASSDNVVVGDPSAMNRIAFNSQGIVVTSTSTGNTLFANEVYANTNLEIDLSATTVADGVTPNDLNDADTGGNDLQNFPVLVGVQRFADSIAVQGTLDRPNGISALSYTITLYLSASCAAGGDNAGVRLLNSRSITLPNGAIESFNYTVTGTGPLYLGAGITATATDSNGNTSELSACQTVTEGAGALVVTNTNSTGAGSLRDAISQANAASGGNVIVFNIPGAGPHTLDATSNGFGSINGPLLIDGYSQPGAAPNTLTGHASNATIKIEIDSPNLTGGINAFTSSAPLTLQGLAFKRGTNGATLVNLIGGASASVIRGNFFGIDSAGVPQPSNISRGVFAGAQTVIGGTQPADVNVFAGLDDAVRFFGPAALGSVMQGNLLGVAPNGVTPVDNDCNISLGANAGALSDVLIGGVSDAQSNVIRNGLSNCPAVSIDSGGGTINAISVLGNHISGNAALGIDIGGNGVTSNDVNDIDTGENGLQNYPVLAFAQQLAAGGVRVVGALDIPQLLFGARYTLSFYSSTSCDPTGFGEGETYLGSQDALLTHVGSPTFIRIEDFEVTLPQSVSLGSFITATATAPDGSTSEFSACTPVTTSDTLFSHNFEG